MKFCIRCGSSTGDGQIFGVCRAPADEAAHPAPAGEYAPAGNLPAFHYTYSVLVLGLLKRERQVAVPFSYINGTLMEVRSYADAARPVHLKLWAERNDPRSGSRGPIVSRESMPSVKSIGRLRLGSGAELSFVLAQAALRAQPGSRITLIFPVAIERALDPVCDHDAIAAVYHAVHDFTWSTANPEIYAIRSRLPGDQVEAFGNSLASYLNGLCRRCLRLSVNIPKSGGHTISPPDSRN
jgi:hypothetical protein